MRIIRLAATIIAVAALSVACAGETDSTPAASGTEPAGPQTNSGNTENPPPDDVTLDGCGPDELGWVTAHGTITNHSSKASTYFVNIEFVTSDGTRYAEGIASSATVAPGQHVEWDASGLTDYRDGTTCRVTSVDRFAG